MNRYALVPYTQGQNAPEGFEIVSSMGIEEMHENGEVMGFTQTHWAIEDANLDSKTLPDGAVKFENSEQLLTYFNQII